MKYAEARSAIKSGDVLAWTHKGIKSWADFEVFIVRLAQRSEYSHVGIAWVIAGRVFILEAVGSGVRIFPLSRACPFYWIPTHTEFTADVEQFALSIIGEKYSKWEAIRGLFSKTRDNDAEWQCAEYVKAILMRMGIELPGATTPSGVVEDLLSLAIPRTALSKVE